MYLKQSVIIEPMFNRWYAWHYLISPATAAMYITHHINLMQSFVDAPRAHEEAFADSSFRSSPFINHIQQGSDRVREVADLLEKTRREQRDMIELAAAIKELDRLLGDEAKGHSLEPLYPKVPDILKGYVELVYDLNNQPSIRLIEGLLFKSQYYKPASQGIALYMRSADDRPFRLNSPRLEEPRTLLVDAPYRHEAIDHLSRMRHGSGSPAAARDALGIRPSDEELFQSFFTEEQPPESIRYGGDGVRVRYFGHACVLVETKDVSVLFDPLVSYNHGGGIPRYTYADLPERIDYVVITHGHQDHCLVECLIQLRHKVENVVVPKNSGGRLEDPSLKLSLQQLGLRRVIEIDEMESIALEGGSLMGLPFLGEHGDLGVRSKSAFLLTLQGKSILCAADSNNIEPRLYERVHDVIGDIDVLFLGMECQGSPLSWIFAPLFTRPIRADMDQSRRFDGSNCEKGMGIVGRLRPRRAYVYAMGEEPWVSFINSIRYTEHSRPIIESNAFVKRCREQGLAAERLFGQTEILLS